MPILPAEQNERLADAKRETPPSANLGDTMPSMLRLNGQRESVGHKETVGAGAAIVTPTPRQLESLRAIKWAHSDPEVQSHYVNEFVVPWEQRIVAHGTDPVAVLAEAARKLGFGVEELPLVGISDPLVDCSDRSFNP